MPRVLTGLLGLFLLGPSLGSASSWLLIPTDVRSRALGNASTALPDLAFALDANPALLTQTDIGNGGLSFGKLQDWPGAEVSLFSAHGTVGSHLIMNRIAVGLAYRQVKTSLLSYGYSDPYGSPGGGLNVLYDRGYMLGLGIVITENAAAGITLKHHTFSSSDGFISASGGWDWDMGLYVANLIPSATFDRIQDTESSSQILSSLTLPRSRGFSLGVAVQNFGDRVRRSGDGPAKVSGATEAVAIGASYLPLLTRPFAILLVGELWMRDPLNNDLLDPYRGNEILRWGVEASVYRLLDLRLGMESDAATGAYYMTSGVGLGPERLRISYSFYWHPEFDRAKLPRLGFSARF